MDTGGRYFLLELAQHLPGLHGLPNAAFITFAGLVFAALTYWCWRTCCRDEDNRFLPQAFGLAAALMLLFSPHYPWYVAWLIPFFALLPNLPAFTYICGLFYLCTTALAVGSGPKQFLLNERLYGSVVLAVAIAFALRRWPIRLAKAEVAGQGLAR